MILRDHSGEVIFAACRHLNHCKDALEAELTAIEEGMRLALHWTTPNFTVETDCSEAVQLIKESTPNTSIYTFNISRIRDVIKERGTKTASINRDANGASHELARTGRVQNRTEVWLRSFPQEISRAVDFDCNPPLA